MITPELIKQLVEVKSGIPDLAIKSRKQNIVLTRDVAISLCKKYTKTPHVSMSKLFGFKSHSQCSYSFRKFINIENSLWFRDYKNLYDVCKDYLDHKLELKKAEYLSVEFEEIN